MGAARRSPAAFWWFAAVAAAAVCAHLKLPADVRPVSYTLISTAPTVPLVVLLRRVPSGGRPTWWLLLAAMTVLSARMLPWRTCSPSSAYSPRSTR